MPNKVNNPNNNFILHFSQEYSDFTGRKEELETLRNFLEDEKKFIWTFITGQGGVGKSRLLLEFCKQVQNDNWVTFYNNNINKLFENPEYFQYNLIIVFDDNVIKSEEVVNIVKENNQRIKKNKVRLIFINRDKPKDYDFLKKSDPFFQENLFENDSLNLKGLNEIDFMDFIKSIVHKKNIKIDVSRLNINEFKQIEPYGRPVFGILLGLAIVEEKNISNWVENDILDYFYKREYIRLQKYFPENELLEKHLNLIAILFICKSSSKESIKKIIRLNKGWLPEPSKFQQNFLNNFLNFDSNTNDWITLYPDIISTYFILQRLEKLDKEILYGFEEIEFILNFIDTELEQKGHDTSHLKLQIIQDFPESEIGFKVLSSFNKEDIIPNAMNAFYSSIIVDIVSEPTFNDHRKIKSYENIFEKLCQTEKNLRPIMDNFSLFKMHLVFKNYEIDKNYFYLKDSTNKYKENDEEQLRVGCSLEGNYSIHFPNIPLPTDFSQFSIIQDIPYIESLALREILLKDLKMNRSKNNLFNRLEKLSKDWSDPRIKRNLLYTVILSKNLLDKNKTSEYILSILNEIVKTSEYQVSNIDVNIRVLNIIIDCIFFAINYLIQKREFAILNNVYKIGLNFIYLLNQDIWRHRKAIIQYMNMTNQLLIDVLYRQGYRQQSEKYFKHNYEMRIRKGL